VREGYCCIVKEILSLATIPLATLDTFNRLDKFMMLIHFMVGISSSI
jgi:hypothetical protein